MTTGLRGHVLLASAVAGVLAVDVATKVAAVAWLAGGPVRLGPLLTLQLVHNRGIAFGVAPGVPAPLVLAGTMVVTGVIAVMAWRGGFGAPFPAGIIVGGALANVADRATGGSVVDFVDVGRWPTFNLADVGLVVGIGLLLVTAGRGTPAPGDVPSLAQEIA